MRNCSGAWRLALGAAVLGILGMVGVGITQSPAAAHGLDQPPYERIYGCGLSNKYGCQSHYLLYQNQGQGAFYIVAHSHACTDLGGDGISWRLGRLETYYRNTPLNLAWTRYDHNYPHTRQWCGWSSGDHSWYPSVQAIYANNRFSVKTWQTHPGAGNEFCAWNIWTNAQTPYNDNPSTWWYDGHPGWPQTC